MLKMLVACARNSSTRDSFSGMIFVKAISNTLLWGPIMLLRRASPYVPVGGIANAAVLNHSRTDGFARLTGCPGTRFGRRGPFVPAFNSSVFPRYRGVNGRPEAIVQSPLHCQSPRMARKGVLPVSQRLS